MPHQPTSLHRESGGLAGKPLVRTTAGLRVFQFAAEAFATALSPSYYDAGMRSAAARQIYLSAWRVLPGFTLACAVLSYLVIQIVVDTAREFGLSQYALELTVRVLVLEIIPLVAALFVALRSGSAISARVAIMHIRGELDALERSGRDPVHRVLVPRAIGAVVALVLLTCVSGALALLLAYHAMYGLSPWGITQFVRITGAVFEPVVVLAGAIKILLLGVAVAAVPISAALSVPRAEGMAARAVQRGMVRLGAAIAVIEAVFLVTLYA